MPLTLSARYSVQPTLHTTYFSLVLDPNDTATQDGSSTRKICLGALVTAGSLADKPEDAPNDPCLGQARQSRSGNRELELTLTLEVGHSTL